MDYFKHDMNASDDDKLCDVLADGGYELYGYYWRFIEYLYNRGGKVKKTRIKSVAWSLHMDSEKLLHLICDFELFKETEDEYYSERVFTTCEEYKRTGAKMAEIGKKGGSAKRNGSDTLSDTQATRLADVKRHDKHMLSEDEASRLENGSVPLTKENKIKENKINKIKEEEVEEKKSDSDNRDRVESEPFFLDEPVDNVDNSVDKLQMLKNVKLTEAQTEKLLDDMGIDMFNYYFDKLNVFIAKNGDNMRSHYDVMMKWWKEDSKL